MSRQEILQSIQTEPQVSVLIIGGGVNGIATFRDLALQGVDVLLVERADFCSGASAASSHMAHGGIRYLENGEFRLVREAVEERNRLIMNAPHYVTPLPTVIPIFKWFSGFLNAPFKFLGLLDKPSERGAAIIKIGLMLYDAYTGAQRTVPRHEFLPRTAALARFPQINPAVIRVAQYYDGLIQAPERICVEMVLDGEAATPQARALNYVQVVGAQGNQVQLRDEISGARYTVSPKLVVNAAGPWIDLTNGAMGNQTRYIGGTKGSHLVLNHPELRQAVGEHEFFFENKDGRIVLLCPLLDKVLVGTSDIRIDNPDEARCTDSEIDYFLGMVARVFPAIQVDRSHIVFQFSGVRPLPAAHVKTTGQISRDHSIEVMPSTQDRPFAIYNLIGGKWTTFRAFAEQATDQILATLGRARQNSTQDLPIGGGKYYPRSATPRQQWTLRQQERSDLNGERVESLLKRYGTRAELLIDFILAQTAPDRALVQKADYSHSEIAFIAKTEKVVHLDDLLLRRSHLAMLGELTTPLLDEIADVLAKALGWSSTRRQEEIERAKTILTDQHGVRF